MSHERFKTGYLNKDDSPSLKKTWKDYYKKWILVWSPLSHIWLFVLLVSVFKNEDASDLSIVSFSIFVFSSIMWFIYGFFVLEEKNFAIIASSVTAFTLGVTSIFAIIAYGDVSSGVDDERGSKKRKAVLPFGL
jgi:uncharacterized protein with PQ loop repeat